MSLNPERIPVKLKIMKTTKLAFANLKNTLNRDQMRAVKGGVAAKPPGGQCGANSGCKEGCVDANGYCSTCCIA